MGYCPWWFSVSLWWICITFIWPRASLKLTAPSSQSERHLHFVSIRLCLALLFIISTFIKNVFCESWHQSPFSKIVANLLRVIEIRHRRCLKWASIFLTLHHSQKNILTNAMIRWKKNPICQVFPQDYFFNSWWKLMKFKTQDLFWKYNLIFIRVTNKMVWKPLNPCYFFFVKSQKEG